MPIFDFVFGTYVDSYFLHNLQDRYNCIRYYLCRPIGKSLRFDTAYSQYKLAAYKMKYNISNIRKKPISVQCFYKHKSKQSTLLKSWCHFLFNLAKFYIQLYSKFAFKNNNLVALTTQHILNSWILRVFFCTYHSLFRQTCRQRLWEYNLKNHRTFWTRPHSLRVGTWTVRRCRIRQCCWCW